jgi:predicted nucleotidyltransferase
MNQVRESLPNSVKDFFYKLSEYLDTELYFYGSINRSDYIHGQSDIDIAIFTDNEYSLISKLQHFLHCKRNAFDKVVWKLKSKMIYGFKIKCDKFMDIKCEIAIYNNVFKDTLLEEFKSYNYVPFHLAILLYILKTFHYTFPLLSKKTYTKYKVYIFNTLLLKKTNTVFFVIDKSKDN